MMSDEKNIVKIDPDLEELIPGFLENRAKDLETMKTAQENNDCLAIQSIGHSLKGVGGGYGFDGMSEIGAAIEIAAKAQDMSKIPELIKQYSDYINSVEVVFE